jgi:hypothetical protein
LRREYACSLRSRDSHFPSRVTNSTPNPGNVTLHTLADPVVPFWQEPVYRAKVQSRHSLSDLNQIPVFAFGHCNVSASDAESALTLLLLKTNI